MGKLIDVSLSATKAAASKRMITHVTNLLTTTDVFPIHVEYKLWIYKILYWDFVTADAVSGWTISKLESIATRFLKKWLNLPHGATQVTLYYPGVLPFCLLVPCTSKLNIS